MCFLFESTFDKLSKLLKCNKCKNIFSYLGIAFYLLKTLHKFCTSFVCYGFNTITGGLYDKCFAVFVILQCRSVCMYTCIYIYSSVYVSSVVSLCQLQLFSAPSLSTLANEVPIESS